LLQYTNNQYAEMVRLQLQYKSVKDEMRRLQMQLANVDSQIVPGQQSAAHDRCESQWHCILYEYFTVSASSLSDII